MKKRYAILDIDYVPAFVLAACSLLLLAAPAQAHHHRHYCCCRSYITRVTCGCVGCTCGCQQGLPCTCGVSVPAAPAVTVPAPSFPVSIWPSDSIRAALQWAQLSELSSLIENLDPRHLGTRPLKKRPSPRRGNRMPKKSTKSPPTKKRKPTRAADESPKSEAATNRTEIEGDWNSTEDDEDDDDTSEDLT